MVFKKKKQEEAVPEEPTETIEASNEPGTKLDPELQRLLKIYAHYQDGVEAQSVANMPDVLFRAELLRFQLAQFGALDAIVQELRSLQGLIKELNA